MGAANSISIYKLASITNDVEGLHHNDTLFRFSEWDFNFVQDFMGMYIPALIMYDVN